MANPLKTIEQGILAGDWDKVVKGYNTLTGKTVKAATTVSKSKVKAAKVKTIVKTVKVYQPDLSLLEALNFYKDEKNYRLNNGRIEILLDNGEKARQYKVPEEYEDSTEDITDDTVQIKTKTKKAKTKNTKDEDDFFSQNYKPTPIIIESTEPEPHSKMYPKNPKNEHREPDHSLDIIEYKCDKCNKIKNFRKFETEKYIQNKKMDCICNDCNRGR